MYPFTCYNCFPTATEHINNGDRRSHKYTNNFVVDILYVRINLSLTNVLWFRNPFCEYMDVA